MAAPSHRTAPTATEPDPTHGTLDDVATRYAIRRPEEVTDYLRRYPHLIPLVLEAADLFPRYFGRDAPLVLEVYSYPDGEPGDQDLFAIVQTPLATDEATDRFFRLLDEWVLAARPPGPGVLVLDIESS
jgi:hypothetical protein